MTIYVQANRPIRSRCLMACDDEDTEPLALPGRGPRQTGGRSESGRGSHRELFPAPRSLSKRWQIERTYEFATPELALLLVACATAVGTVTGVWPVVELEQRRVRLRLASAPAAGTPEGSAWRELEGWARKLGGEPVAAGSVT